MKELLALVLVIGALCASCAAHVEEANVPAPETVSWQEADYDSILRDPLAYTGYRVRVYGKVLQVSPDSEDSSRKVMRLGTGGYGTSDNVFWISFCAKDVDREISRDDMVTVFGECLGARTYASVTGYLFTVPVVRADRIIPGKAE